MAKYNQGEIFIDTHVKSDTENKRGLKCRYWLLNGDMG